jgi:branched-chain amino acid transport system permease protein
VNERCLFTAVFALGALLAGFGGAVAIPREPASLNVDLAVVSDAFVVVVVGGLGSIPGAFLAALLIGEVKAFCTGFGFSGLTLAIEFVVMAAVLIARPWGLLGKPSSEPRAGIEPRLEPFSRRQVLVLAGAAVLLALLPLASDGYTLVLLGDILVFALFAASLHFLVGPAGMTSFGHAAYFGIGAYAASLLLLRAHLPMELALGLAPAAALASAAVFGWFCVRLSGIYLAMLTLAFAQIAWSLAYQMETVTGGSNGLVGVWPAAWLASRPAYYYVTLLACCAGIALLWRMMFSPFGYALRAGRDSPERADAIGIDTRRVQWGAFCIAGTLAGLAGAMFAFSKGSISPETLAVPRSVDGLVMVLLGGVQTVTGPIWGAALLTWLQDELARDVAYWRAAVGAVILALVLALPSGLSSLTRRRR